MDYQQSSSSDADVPELDLDLDLDGDRNAASSASSAIPTQPPSRRSAFTLCSIVARRPPGS
jgi:hypothetical protein